MALLAGSLLGSGALAPPAHAAISFTRTVDKPTAAPGENVTFTLQFTCSVQECVNGRITDLLPPSLEFVGWSPDPTTVDVANSTLPDLGPGTTAAVTVVRRFPNWTTADGTSASNTAQLTVDGETPQTVQLDAWNPPGIQLTFQYRLNGDPTWLTFTPGTPFDGSGNRRIAFEEGAGDPANDVLGLPTGRWPDGVRLTWNGPLPTGWSPGSGVQVVTRRRH
ncbi:DUF11 domain-containing protein [Kitasatospora sp. CB01950]|uniref:DUF11 domain-containing protein n=1 Tax=Kitasatospora sp. CB01950 TaxID=1703930 RepID=UPI0009389385|nr:DUF11 domain-containing protein [Kitasatospora sp. CB01950]